MKRKLLATLLAVSMAISLCACGNQGESGVSQPDVNPTTGESTTNDVPENPTSDSQQTEGNPTTGEENTPDVTQDVSGGETIDTPAPEDSETGKPEGLILMTTTDINLRDPKISCVNIETGESTVIAEFNFMPKTLQDTIMYSPAAGFSCGHREWFTSDYSKVAVSRLDTQSGQTSVGWIDTNGDFFDVSEALGQLDRSDFDDPVTYRTVGFTDDGFFVYKQVSGSGLSAQISYHYVPIDNIDPSVIQDGVPFPGYEEDMLAKVTVSDYIGDSCYLINTSDGVSQIFDMATGEKTAYVPGTARFSWHAVLSPNGSQVAFMSQPKGGLEKDIYIMPLEGGDPVKVPTDSFSLSSQHGCETGHDYGSSITMLVDWQ